MGYEPTAKSSERIFVRFFTDAASRALANRVRRRSQLAMFVARQVSLYDSKWQPCHDCTKMLVPGAGIEPATKGL
jgi:hypothetical protein